MRNRKFLKSILTAQKGQKIGFVPTMGALHKGHESLILQSKRCDITICSIFVNQRSLMTKLITIITKNLDSDLTILKNPTVISYIVLIKMISTIK